MLDQTEIIVVMVIIPWPWSHGPKLYHKRGGGGQLGHFKAPGQR